MPLTSGDVDVSVQQSLAPQSYLSIDVCACTRVQLSCMCGSEVMEKRLVFGGIV